MTADFIEQNQPGPSCFCLCERLVKIRDAGCLEYAHFNVRTIWSECLEDIVTCGRISDDGQLRVSRRESKSKKLIVGIGEALTRESDDTVKLWSERFFENFAY
jgi:hypothetical protein